MWIPERKIAHIRIAALRFNLREETQNRRKRLTGRLSALRKSVF
jgi:hypothetical protein